jgi:hypothetical protein
VDEKKRQEKGKQHNADYNQLIKLLLNCSGKKYYLLDVILIFKQVKQVKNGKNL